MNIINIHKIIKSIQVNTSKSSQNLLFKTHDLSWYINAINNILKIEEDKI